MWKNWPLRKKNSTQKYPHKTGMAGPRHFVRNLVIKYFWVSLKSANGANSANEALTALTKR
jgi:hypothetical protein